VIFVCSLSPGQLNSAAALFNELGHKSGPTGLMARSYAGPVVAMKVFVEMKVVSPVRIVLKLGEPTVNGSISVGRAQKNSRQSP
jgi:hypothetical protein